MNRKIGILGWFALAGLAAAAGSLELNDYLGEEWTDPRSRAGIWELHFTRPEDVSVRQEVQPSHAAKVDVTETNGVKTCVWRDFWKHGDKLESVTVTATPGTYPREWCFRLSAKIRPGWVMTDAHFPRVTLREKIAGRDDRALPPPRTGSSARRCVRSCGAARRFPQSPPNAVSSRPPYLRLFVDLVSCNFRLCNFAA